jgi:hypothetical protein
LWFSKGHGKHNYNVLRCDYKVDETFVRIAQQSNGFYILLKFSDFKMNQNNLKTVLRDVFNNSNMVVKYSSNSDIIKKNGMLSSLVTNIGVEGLVDPWWANISWYAFENYSIFYTIKAIGNTNPNGTSLRGF